jgi:AraC-like DNA-binding protein
VSASAPPVPKVQAHAPAPPLSDFVEAIWLAEVSGATPCKERTLPDGSTELVIDLRGDALEVADGPGHARLHSHRGGILIGPRSESFNIIDATGETAVLGVHFRPGGVFPFLAPPAGELSNAVVSIEDIWGARARELRERLLMDRRPAARFRIVERFLLAMAARPLVRHVAVHFALEELRRAPLARISEITDRIGISQRRFIQVFRDEVGLPPKLFARVRRFQAVLELIAPMREVDWASVAARCGYYDQSHFVNDFRAFSGLTPTAYLARRGARHPSHVPLSG